VQLHSTGPQGYQSATRCIITRWAHDRRSGSTAAISTAADVALTTLRTSLSKTVVRRRMCTCRQRRWRGLTLLKSGSSQRQSGTLNSADFAQRRPINHEKRLWVANLSLVCHNTLLASQRMTSDIQPDVKSLVIKWSQQNKS